MSHNCDSRSGDKPENSTHPLQSASPTRVIDCALWGRPYWCRWNLAESTNKSTNSDEIQETFFAGIFSQGKQLLKGLTGSPQTSCLFSIAQDSIFTIVEGLLKVREV